jgi:hypothetical protein
MDLGNNTIMNASLNGVQCILFYDERIASEKAPLGYHYIYHLRHDEDDWTRPISIERFVVVNFFGTVFTKEPIEIDESGYVEIESFRIETQFIIFRLSGSVFNSMFCLPE